jgi:FkbM family methyltransferase
MSLEQRQYLLDCIEKRERAIKRWNKFVKPGLFKKLRKAASFPLWHTSPMLERIFSRDTKIQTLWARTLVSPAGGITTQLLRHCGFYGVNDVKILKFFVRHLRQDEIFYDVGANIGLYATLAQEISLEGEVHAFEPSPTIFNYLRENVGSRAGTFLNNEAITDTPGTAQLYASAANFCHSLSTIHRDVEKYLNSAGIGRRFSRISVASTTIDLYVENHRPPSVIKIDVEGAEELVLRGAEKTLKKTAPIIVMEVWAEEQGKRIHYPAVRFLAELGYQPHRITADGEIEPLADLGELWKAATYEHYDNFIFRK